MLLFQCSSSSLHLYLFSVLHAQSLLQNEFHSWGLRHAVRAKSKFYPSVYYQPIWIVSAQPFLTKSLLVKPSFARPLKKVWLAACNQLFHVNEEFFFNQFKMLDRISQVFSS